MGAVLHVRLVECTACEFRGIAGPMRTVPPGTPIDQVVAFRCPRCGSVALVALPRGKGRRAR